jgi:hypothetical protein
VNRNVLKLVTINYMAIGKDFFDRLQNKDVKISSYGGKKIVEKPREGR